MRNATRWMITMAAVAALAAAIGCAKPPQVEIDAVGEALQQADLAEAATYAPEELEAARESQRMAVAEIEAQKERFALSRSYDKAKELLQKTMTEAEAARAAAVENREAALASANQAVESLAVQLATAEADLVELAKCRRAPKGFAQDLELMRGKVEALVGQLTELDAEIASERYKSALELAESIEPEMAAVATDLSTARAKLGC
ncbi:MAG: hypothetical protein AB1Z65_05380 [Candidatus Sulfomarinibacteraceae bacterium]